MPAILIVLSVPESRSDTAALRIPIYRHSVLCCLFICSRVLCLSSCIKLRVSSAKYIRPPAGSSFIGLKKTVLLPVFWKHRVNPDNRNRMRCPARYRPDIEVSSGSISSTSAAVNVFAYFLQLPCRYVFQWTLKVICVRIILPAIWARDDVTDRNPVLRGPYDGFQYLRW